MLIGSGHWFEYDSGTWFYITLELVHVYVWWFAEHDLGKLFSATEFKNIVFMSSMIDKWLLIGVARTRTTTSLMDRIKKPGKFSGFLEYELLASAYSHILKMAFMPALSSGYFQQFTTNYFSRWRGTLKKKNMN